MYRSGYHHRLVRQAEVIEPTDGIAIVQGMAFVVPSAEDSPVSRRLIATGRTEPQFTELVARLVRRGQHVADLGANIGYFTCIMAQATGPGGRVLAFEPVARPRSYLQHNLVNNGFSHVTVDPRAIADFNGRGHLTLPAYRLQQQVTGEERVAFDVEVGRFDDVARGLGVERVDFIKVDVEGSELRALEGMRSSIEAWRPLLAIEVHPTFLPLYDDSVAALDAFLDSVDYAHVPVEPPNESGYHIVAGTPEALGAARLLRRGQATCAFELGDPAQWCLSRGSVVRGNGAYGRLDLAWKIEPGDKEYLLTGSHATKAPPEPASRYPLAGDGYTELRWRAALTGTATCGLWLFEYDDRALLTSASYQLVSGDHIIRHVTQPGARSFRLGLRLAGAGGLWLDELALMQWPDA